MFKFSIHQTPLAAAATFLLLTGCNSASQQADFESQRSELLQAQATQDKIDVNKPVTADTHFAAGQLAQSEGELPLAQEQYQAALKLDPNHANSLLGLGLVFVSTQQYKQALPLFQRYVTATHGSAAAYSDLGFCLQLMGNTTEAINAYRAGVAADPTNQPCRMNYGLLLAKLGDLRGANEQLGAVLTPAEVHYDLGSVLQSQGQLEKAKAEFHAALAINPDMADAKARLASLE